MGNIDYKLSTNEWGERVIVFKIWVDWGQKSRICKYYASILGKNYIFVNKCRAHFI